MELKNKTGFALLSPEERKAMSTKAGKLSQASGKGHRYTSEEARKHGRTGGLASSEKRKKALLEANSAALIKQ